MEAKVNPKERILPLPTTYRVVTKKTLYTAGSVMSFMACLAGGLMLVQGTGGKGPLEPVKIVLGALASIGFGGLSYRLSLLNKSPIRLWEGVTAWVVVAFLYACIYPALQSAKSAATNSDCLSNVKDLAVSIHAYAIDNNDRLPAAERWRSTTEGYRASFPRCFYSQAKQSYAFNDQASGLKLESVADLGAVMIFEIESDEGNAHGGRGALVYRHHSGTNMAFVDGHAKRVRTEAVNWNPNFSPTVP